MINYSARFDFFPSKLQVGENYAVGKTLGLKKRFVERAGNGSKVGFFYFFSSAQNDENRIKSSSTQSMENNSS